MAIAYELRIQLAERCRSRRTRLAAFTPRAPIDWRPSQLRDPRDPQNYFTEDGAWEFIAEKILEGCEIGEKILDKPPGKKAYVIICKGVMPVSLIYIKLQLGSGNVIGRSFHESL